MKPSTVQIVHLVKDWDMRLRHSLREGRKASGLKRSQALLAFNRAGTMARIIDASGAVHDFYAEAGEEFDVTAVSNQLSYGFNVTLKVGREEKVKGRISGARLRRAA